MNLTELKASDKAVVTPADVAEVLGCDAHLIRVAAHQNPQTLGFPVCVVGRRVKIPRKPFIQFIEGGTV